MKLSNLKISSHISTHQAYYPIRWLRVSLVLQQLILYTTFLTVVDTSYTDKFTDPPVGI